jgi:hypothetical protein
LIMKNRNGQYQAKELWDRQVVKCRVQNTLLHFAGGESRWNLLIVYSIIIH